ncbi:MAG: 4Fe-4S binding protein [Planctomycetes bacterium]|nr:4Fe-4S binding protein [Planctomycetota bacterium]
MSKDDQTTRRQFLKGCARGAGVVAVGAVAAGLTVRADADKVWQLNPTTCTTCRDFTNDQGWGRCSTACVRTPSAVKAVNDFTVCGYCFICPAYFDVQSPVYTWEEAEQLGPYPDGTSREGTHKKLICPQDAIRRRVVGQIDPYDPYNNFFEYTIDEGRCNGCGLCVEYCRPPMGNASLRLEVRHHLCLDCNQCAIARTCPANAFYRGSLRAQRPGYEGGTGPVTKGHPS